MACSSYVEPRGLPDIEGWYNPARRHSGLGYRSPMAYEADREANPDHAVAPKPANRPPRRGNPNPTSCNLGISHLLPAVTRCPGSPAWPRRSAPHPAGTSSIA